VTKAREQRAFADRWYIDECRALLTDSTGHRCGPEDVVLERLDTVQPLYRVTIHLAHGGEAVSGLSPDLRRATRTAFAAALDRLKKQTAA
jgi:hypothetical protein